MAEVVACEHPPEAGMLEDIEYLETEKTKEVSLYYNCSKCGSNYTTWLCKQKK